MNHDQFNGPDFNNIEELHRKMDLCQHGYRAGLCSRCYDEQKFAALRWMAAALAYVFAVVLLIWMACQ